MPVENTNINWPYSVGGAPTFNSHAIQFHAATADWGVIVAAGFCDAPVGGNVWWFDNLAEPETVLAGGDFGFEPGDCGFAIS